MRASGDYIIADRFFGRLAASTSSVPEMPRVLQQHARGNTAERERAAATRVQAPFAHIEAQWDGPALTATKDIPW